jgi:hypothetical protein
MPRCIRCDQPGLRFILNYCSQRSSRERIENGTDRSNARNRAALRRSKPASNERPVSLATPSHARGAALGNKSYTRAAVAAACELSGATASPMSAARPH